jgi:polyisoprenoid-binding protein YceI
MSESTTTLPTPDGIYDIDAVHSRIGFVARHAMVTKIRGSFNEFTGSGTFDVEDPEKISFEISINASSIDTRNEMRDTHLKSNDFLDMEKFPNITFKSSKVALVAGKFSDAGPVQLKVTGYLTIKGVAKEIDIAMTYEGAAVDPYGNYRVGLEGTATINRSDFGITWNGVLETGGVLVSEQISIEIEVSAIKRA